MTSKSRLSKLATNSSVKLGVFFAPKIARREEFSVKNSVKKMFVVLKKPGGQSLIN